MKLKYSLLIYLSLTAASCWADDKAALASANQSPLEIDSDDGVTCDKQQQTCTAKTNVVVVKGPFSMYCDNMVAHIKKDDNGKNTIWRIVATGNVRILGAEESEKAFAPMAEYNLETAKVILTGGNPVVLKDEYVIKGDKIEVLLFEQDGKKSIQKMEAFQNVILSSPDEIAFSQYADYDPESRLATLKDNVKIYRKEGKLTGSKAVVDLTAKTSKITENSNGQDYQPKRVQALILPKNVDKTEKKRLFHEE